MYACKTGVQTANTGSNIADVGYTVDAIIALTEYLQQTVIEDCIAYQQTNLHLQCAQQY